MRELDPGTPRQADVDDRDVRRRPYRLPDRLGSVTGLPDDPQICLRLQSRSDRFPEQRLTVSEEDADLLPVPGYLALWGSHTLSGRD